MGRQHVYTPKADGGWRPVGKVVISSRGIADVTITGKPTDGKLQLSCAQRGRVTERLFASSPGQTRAVQVTGTNHGRTRRLGTALLSPSGAASILLDATPDDGHVHFNCRPTAKAGRSSGSVGSLAGWRW